ncbi:MAG: dihydrolipoyl dehydrogenase [Deltaproteobacteria bacterium]|nr:dihydrolipoyl dehydrogenase [Deltaproteobacteria bacterium]MBI4223457.1 dihydrolipoyl dehydrogenase [Deltaproteobacteria bacterium]
MRKYDAVVIGAGPGGYVAAIRLAQYGQKVALVEKETVGGVCLNVGCIPSKALINASEIFRSFTTASAMGLEVAGAKVDVKKLQSWKNDVVKKLTGGIAILLKASKIDLLKGEARFVSNREIAVDKEEIRFDNAIVATGSRPAVLKGFEPDGKFVGTSTEGLGYENIPKELCVIGGGYIGLEIGSLYASFGSQVTVVEATDSLLPGTDPDLVRVVQKELKKRGVKIHLKSQALSWKGAKGRAEVHVASENGEQVIPADKILVAVGRVPNTQNIGLEALGVALDQKGFIKIDHQLKTNVDGIFAIGDCAGGALLAHKASKEGVVAAGVIAGKKMTYDVRAMPAVIFTTPEIAYVGLSEAEAKMAGHTVKVGKFPFMASGKALAIGETEGFVKIISDAGTERILGVAIVGYDASHLIGEACLAIEMGACAEDIALTVHPHPTLSESFSEAAEAIHGTAIHLFTR